MKRVLPLLILCACGPAQVPFTDDDACFGVAVDELVLTEAWIGVAREGTILVENLCDRSVTIRVDVSGSEAFSASDATVAPLSDYVFPVTFTAPGYGAETAILRFASVEIALLGQADADQDGDGYDAVAAGGEDCDDTDASVFPGAADSGYDGVDSDCAGDDDFDRDGDGYVPDAYASLSTLPAGDCDDVRADVNPSAAADEWYDGVDQDCAGNDDYDADLDGFASDSYGGTDCDDADSAIFPGASGDEWYDGVDTDCAGNDDYDADLDGSGVGDCDDTDPAVLPGALEAMADGVDQDCDGADDTAAWADGGYAWDDVHALIVGRNDLHWVLTTAAESTDATVFPKPGISLIFPSLPAAGESPVATVVWQNNSTTPFPMGEGVDMIMGTDEYYAGIQYHYASSGKSYLMGKRIAWNASSGTYSSKLAYMGYTAPGYHDDVDIALDASTGKYWYLGCGADGVSFLRVDPALWAIDGSGCDADSTDCLQFDGIVADTCWLDVSGTVATAHVCGAGDCATFELDGAAETITAAAEQPYDGSDWASVNRSGDWLVAVGADGAIDLSDGSASYTLFADDSYEAKHAEVAEDAGGRLYVAAVVADATGDGLDDVLLAHGDPSGALSTTLRGLTDGATTWNAEYVSIGVDDDRVMVGATGYVSSCADPSGECDTVAWMFVTPP